MTWALLEKQLVFAWPATHACAQTDAQADPVFRPSQSFGQNAEALFPADCSLADIDVKHVFRAPQNWQFAEAPTHQVASATEGSYVKSIALSPDKLALDISLHCSRNRTVHGAGAILVVVNYRFEPRPSYLAILEREASLRREDRRQFQNQIDVRKMQIERLIGLISQKQDRARWVLLDARKRADNLNEHFSRSKPENVQQTLVDCNNDVIEGLNILDKIVDEMNGSAFLKFRTRLYGGIAGLFLLNKCNYSTLKYVWNEQSEIDSMLSRIEVLKLEIFLIERNL